MIARFSVLITTYKNDSPAYLDEAIKSIYFKQIIKPDEIILIADGPLNKELINIIEINKKNIPALKFFNLDENKGLAYALNYGIKKCSNELIFRMDSDDISLPLRFKKQLSFMQSNPDIDICGSYVNLIDPVTKVYLSTRKVPIHQNEIYRYAKKRSPMNHPSVVFRKSSITKNGNYPLFKKAQDYALWSKLLIVENIKFQNIPEVLVHMRGGNSLLTRRGLKHLSSEIKVILFQKKIGFLNTFECIRNILLRAIFRLSPNFIKKILYKMVK